MHGLTIVSGQGTNNLVVKNNGLSNNKTISVSIITQDCGTQSYSKIIMVGKPSTPSDITGNETIFVNQGGTIINPSRTYSIAPVSKAIYYEWELPGNYVVLDQLTSQHYLKDNWELLASTANSNSIEVKSNLSTNGYIKVRACNDCGCSEYKSLYIEHIAQNSGGFFDISPNPTSGIGMIGLSNHNNIPKFANGYTSVQVYNAQTILLKRFEISEKGGSFDVQDLPSGIYKVQIDLQNGSFQVINLKVFR